MADKDPQQGRFPPWLRRALPRGGGFCTTGRVLREQRMPTVCEEAKCPNQLECWACRTATFLVMGTQCTRKCGFCSVDHAAAPAPLEVDEPERLARAVAELGIRHAVVTMVTRDDLADGGARHLARCIEEIRVQCPGVTVEVLTSDFQGDTQAIDQVVAAHPEVFGHNIETVRSLSGRVRCRATYDRTLDVLRYVSSCGLDAKSGLMVGLGETDEEVFETLRDLQSVGCRAVTIGQYLQPSRQQLRPKAFVTPENFQRYETFGRSVGIDEMVCGPFVRSSYRAHPLVPRQKKDHCGNVQGAH